MRAIPNGDGTTNAEARSAQYRAKADALSSRLYHLGNIARLAAFAAQARNTLESIEQLKSVLPDVSALINEHVEDPNDWCEKQDVSGQVLSWLANEMERLDAEMTESMYSVVRGEEVTS